MEVTFYHSAVCPRCHVSGFLLERALRKHPLIRVKKVEFLTHRDDAREDGVKSIPALAAEGRTLAGFLLTPARIEGFLESLEVESG
jgi:predicted thioredoxin/glutaredoxin